MSLGQYRLDRIASRRIGIASIALDRRRADIGAAAAMLLARQGFNPGAMCFAGKAGRVKP